MNLSADFQRKIMTLSDFKEVNLIVLWLMLDSKDDFISIDFHFFFRLYVLFSVPLLPLKKAR